MLDLSCWEGSAASHYMSLTLTVECTFAKDSFECCCAHYMPEIAADVAHCRASPVLMDDWLGCVCVGRFVVLLSSEHDYFFVLYIVYFAAQAWLAVLALAHYPGEQDLDPLPENISLIVYEVPQPLPRHACPSCLLRDEVTHLRLLSGCRLHCAGKLAAAAAPRACFVSILVPHWQCGHACFEGLQPPHTVHHLLHNVLEAMADG